MTSFHGRHARAAFLGTAVIVLLLGLVGWRLADASRRAPAGPWPSARIAWHLPIAPWGTVVQPGSDYVVGFPLRTCIDPCPVRLERLDLATHTVRSGPEVTADTSLVALAHGIAAVSPAAVAPDDTVSGRWLISLFSQSLTLAARHHIAIRSAYPVAAANGGSGTADVWVGAGHRLELVDGLTGRTLVTDRVSFSIVQLAVSPNRQRLYVVGLPYRSHSGAVVDEYARATGKLLGSATVASTGNPPILTPTDSGVWVAPGNAPPELLARVGLRRVQLAEGALPRPGRGAYQDTVSNLGSFVLVESERGMSCLSPTTGHPRAESAWASGRHAPTWTPLVLRGRRLLALALYQRAHVNSEPVRASAQSATLPANDGVLQSVTVPPACFA